MNTVVPVIIFQKIGFAPKNSHLKHQWCAVRKLEKLLTFLVKHNYTFITPKDLQKPLPAKPILLAFMDGYQSVYKDVFPLLKKYNAQATVFVATDTLGTYNSWQDPYLEPWQNIVTAQQLKEMHQNKCLQVGTLGLSGRNLLADTRTQLVREELLESIHRLETLYNIKPCAIGFWPNTKVKPAQLEHIIQAISLPVIVPNQGANTTEDIPHLRIFFPSLFTRFLLWKNK